ncbi:MAG: lycopene cyclase domain-containing protein [Caldilineaceae bacterium]|nr:lycopene cyclase domain-containing protein [Caldilineaceae bacterium]
MTYFAFLALFVGIPIVLLLGVAWLDVRAGRRRPAALANWPVAGGILLHALIALLYTTPWDNYLVATGVWWYDPALVTGVVLGWVPIEEYTFFVVQPILAGLWLTALTRRLPRVDFAPNPAIRWFGVAFLGTVWLGAVAIPLLGWRPGTYLFLELAWALPPIALQWGFGGDILWRNRRLVLLALVPLTLYLSGADAIAIGAGTWTIDPAQSTGWLLGGVLPIEEFIFFGLTNTLVTFGLVLIWAAASRTLITTKSGRRFTQKQLI